MAKKGNPEPEIGLGLDDEDRLPWLEAADNYDDEGDVSPARLVLLVVGGLLLIGAVLGALWWVQNGGSRGQGELIAAQDGGYKVAPKDDAAKQFEGEGDASFRASEGSAPDGRVDPTRLPEEPAVTLEKRAEMAKAAEAKALAAAKATPASRPVAKPGAPVAKSTVVTSKAPVGAAEKASTAGGSALIQLGAFSSEESAAKAWIALAKKFPALGSLSKSVAPATVNGAKVYRLRATAPNAAEANSLCGKLKVAGSSCDIVR